MLTWDMELPGEPFVEKAAPYAGFSDTKNVLEVGPGYGRILKACVEGGLPFDRYYGLDLSEETCSHLRERFPLENVRFVTGDAESATFEINFDIVLSSLTLKHLFPSCEAAFENLGRSASPGAVLCFDFVESKEPESFWQGDTFVRFYTRSELVEMLARTGLEHVAFDEVRHASDPQWWRLLMVARKPT
jgi:SAM-dependent methyltransferase